jgi:hypothetical protein
VSIVRAIGRFYETDFAGSLINECAASNVHPEFCSDIDCLQSLCKEAAPPVNLHSLYLRGSVPRGLASTEHSDIDSFAILEADRDVCADYQSKVRLGCLSIKRKVDFCAFSLDEVDTLPDWELAFVIKIHSLCIFGRTLIPSLRDYKPSKSIVAGYVNIADVVRHARDAVLNKPESAAHVCKWIAKRYLRTGLALCIERDQRYSPDLWPCYCVFRDWYPEHSQDMLTALEVAVSDAPDLQAGVRLLDGFGQWISQEACLRLSGN